MLGVVGREEHRAQVLVPRQDLTGANRIWAARYNPGNMLRYSRCSQETGIGKGEYTRVKSVDALNNRLTAERQWETACSSPRPSPNLKLANRELGTVEGIGQQGRMSLKMDGGREVELDSVKNPHLDHGYAVTCHSSQGQTADRVLIHVDTELAAKDLLNSRMAYVAVSRGAYDAQLFTNDREKLGAALGHDVSHSSAHVPEMKPEQKQEQAVTPQREIAPQQEQSLDIGLGL
jgi:hypothetical protein